MSSECPRCKADWKCPCPPCTRKRLTLNPEDRVQTWRYLESDPNTCQCFTCGISVQVDTWEPTEHGSTDWRYFPWTDYVTRKAHGRYPIGTPCRAVRDYRHHTTLLRFDEELIDVKNLPLTSDSVFSLFGEDLRAMEDELCLQHLEEARRAFPAV